MLTRRLKTGSLLVIGLVALAWGDARLAAELGRNGAVFAGAAAALLVPLAAIEAARLLRAAGNRTSTAASILGAEAMFLAPLAASLAATPAQAVGLAMLGPFVAMTAGAIAVCRARRVEGGFTGVASVLAAACWTGLLPAFWVLTIREVGATTAAGLVLVVKSGDIGAYFTGMAVGRRKLIPWLSPGKTVEGGVGAVIWSTSAGLILAVLTPEIPLFIGVIGGAVLGVVGAAGDLLESLLKREAGAKDSGDVLPGMGGVLDVLDSLLLAAPIAWLVVILSA